MRKIIGRSLGVVLLIVFLSTSVWGATQDFKGTINGNTITAGTGTLTMSAGKTLTVSESGTIDEAVALSSKAPKASPIFTGDVELAGKVTNATLPAFLAVLSAKQNNVTGDGTFYVIPCNTEVKDQGANYDGAGTFTAPITGGYKFSITNLDISGIAAGHTTLIVQLITSNRTYTLLGIYSNLFTTFGSEMIVSGTADADMDLGDVAYFVVYVTGGAAGKVVDIEAAAVVSGSLTY